jgi:hypothetical protein
MTTNEIKDEFNGPLNEFALHGPENNEIRLNILNRRTDPVAGAHHVVAVKTGTIEP